MNRFTLEQHTPSYRPPASLPRHGFNGFFEAGWESIRRHKMVVRALLTSDRGLIRLTKSASRFNERLQHCLQIERRTADDLEYVGGGGLLLQRFAQLVEQGGGVASHHPPVGESGGELGLLW